MDALEIAEGPGPRGGAHSGGTGGTSTTSGQASGGEGSLGGRNMALGGAAAGGRSNGSGGTRPNMTPAGGSLSLGGTGGNSGTLVTSSGGTSPRPDNEAGENSGGSGGSGSDDPPPPLSFCSGLQNITTLAIEVTRGFLDRVGQDCAATLLYESYASMPTALYNRILQWHPPLWGCISPPASSFDLVAETTQLSRGDVSRLVSYYVEAAESSLGLPESELRALRARITYLAEAKVVSESSEPSRAAECSDK